MPLYRRFSLVIILVFCSLSSLFAQTQAALQIGTADTPSKISSHIYGMFSEHLGRDIYDGFWVGENSSIPNKNGIRLDIVEALKKIHVPVLRWPGGCFADEYHWMDGIGPKENRPEIVNTNWGMVTENNHFGTHEFMALCDMMNSQAYIAGNMGSGTVQEMSQWVEYLNSDRESAITKLRKSNGRDKPWKVQFWGVGNESWGCGGNMTPEQYSSMYRQYATFCKDYPGAPLKKIASGPNGNDTHWMEVVMKNIPHWLMWGVSLHYYTIPTGNWGHKGSATRFNEEEYFGTMKRALYIGEVIDDQEKIMDRYDPEKKVALVVDEWGIWTDAEPGTNPAFLYQQNSLRDALVAATTLNIFNNHCDRIKMANLAQTVNVLQSLVLTKGSQMILTPTYFVFDMFQVHQDATLLPVSLTSPDYLLNGQKIPAVNASASKDSEGIIHISFVNIDASKSIQVKTTLAGSRGSQISGEVLSSSQYSDCNTFADPHKVGIKSFAGFKQDGDKLTVNLPPHSVVVVALKK